MSQSIPRVAEPDEGWRGSSIVGHAFLGALPTRNIRSEAPGTRQSDGKYLKLYVRRPLAPTALARAWCGETAGAARHAAADAARKVLANPQTTSGAGATIKGSGRAFWQPSPQPALFYHSPELFGVPEISLDSGWSNTHATRCHVRYLGDKQTARGRETGDGSTRLRKAPCGTRSAGGEPRALTSVVSRLEHRSKLTLSCR